MKNLLTNSKFALFFAIFLLLATSIPQITHAATKPKPQVMVLPFQVNAGPEMPNAARDIPEMIVNELNQNGLNPMPMSRTRNLFSGSGLNKIDLETARRLGRQSGVKLIIYGNFNQLGDGFNMETRIVPVDEGAAVPVGFERNSLVALNECISVLASKTKSLIAPTSQDTQTSSQDSNLPLVPMQTPQSSAGGLADIQIRGMQNMDPDTVLLRLSIKKGDKPDATAINEEIKRIWDMGYFTDVQARIEGNVLVFQVVEKPRIENIIVEGSKNVDNEDVIAAMTTKSGNVLNEQVLSDDLQKVTELYKKEGFYLAKANYRIESRDGGRGAILVITVEEGSKLYIKDVKIEGLKELKKGDMDKYIALRPRNIFSWLTGTGVLKDEYLERDSNAIAAFGLNEGYLDIQVSAPNVEYKQDGIYITFTVNEGKRYKVRDVIFSGDIIEDEETMLKIIEYDDWLKDSKYFHLTTMQEDSKRLTDYYSDFGYAFAEIDARPNKVDGDEPLVDVVFHITKRQKIFIRRLTLEGNTKTRDNVILREMRLGDGDQYEGAKLRRSAERLNRLRYFSAVDTELIPTENEDEVDLKIKVKEDNTGALMGGIGYSTYYDVGVSASIMERNLFGKGYWLQLQGFFSWRRTAGTLSFTNPRVYDTDLSAGNDLYYTREYWDEYTKDTAGDTIRFSYPVGEYTTVGLNYRLERYELYDVDRNASRYITDYKGINWTSAISGRILRDTTDSREKPSKGTITRLFGEYGGGGLGGTDNFIKAVFDWQGFLSLKPDHTLHLRTRVGGVFQNSSKLVPVFERFWLGGMDSIRGYSYTDISPRDKRKGYNHDHIGGDRIGVANFEYIWTFQKELGLAIVPFVDTGFNIDHESMGHELDQYIVASAGLELRWKSPMGDLRIAYGFPLVQDYDKEMENGRLEFSMGQFF